MKHTWRTRVALLAASILFAASVVLAQEPTVPAMLLAKFTVKLNTKSTKPGDPVTATTIRAAKTVDGKAIPKGTQILGKVVAVAPHQGKDDSKLAIKLDQLELNGAMVPIEAQIVAIGPMSEATYDGGDNSYLGIGHSTPAIAVDPVATTTTSSGGLGGGSTLPGVILGLHLNDAGASELEGFKRDIKLDSSVAVKVRLN